MAIRKRLIDKLTIKFSTFLANNQNKNKIKENLVKVFCFYFLTGRCCVLKLSEYYSNVRSHRNADLEHLQTNVSHNHAFLMNLLL